MKNNETSRDLGTFDSLLEIEGPVVNLLPTDFIVDPPRRLILSANLRLRLMADQSVLDEQFGIEVRGASYSLRGWTVNQAQNFRKELRLASQRFSEKILHDYFIPYHFSERTFDESGTEYRLKGLKPLSVRESTHVPYLLVKTLRPTLQWERFPVENATYDLKVWKLLDVTEDIRELVYERKGLTQNIHTLESSLVRSTTYIWTVRARFLNDGKLRITDWSKYRKNPSWFRKIWSVASFPPMIDPHFPDWEFYYIRTEAGHVGK